MIHFCTEQENEVL